MPDQTTTVHEPAIDEDRRLEDEPAIEDGLIEHELPSRPRRRRLLGLGGNPIALALLCLLLTVCGFIGGVLVEKGEGGSGSGSSGASGGLASRLAALRGGSGSTSTRGSSSAGGSAGGGTFLGSAAGGGATSGGASGSASGGAAPTVGQVSFVHGHTLYVTDFEGNTIKVNASAAASVTKTVKSSVKAIHPGETVIITGASDGNGVVSAQSIRASEAGVGVGVGLGAALFGDGGGGGGGGGFAGARGGGESSRSGTGASSGDSEGPVLFGK